MFIKLAIFVLVFSSAGLLAWQYFPLLAERISGYQTKKVKESAKRLDTMFVKVPAKKLFLIHTLAPLAAAAIGFLLTGKLFIALISAAFGLVLPTIIIKRLDVNRKRKFQAQLVDSLMILSSSLKGGLSLLQSIETVVEEMPAPISQEFALVLRENKMGIPLDESLEGLNRRMKSDELNLITTAISVARETGGNLPQTFTQLIYTIREKTKLMGKIRTLTTQGRLQGAIMSFLPIGFAGVVYSLNPRFFDIMLQNQLGQFLLGYALVSQLIGIFLIMKFSRVEV
ncbi:MAG: type II secretion system F family protein [Candidatus Omnitrophica bacterium]|nr:type II secretion system F family protein [Candidatus Omnitrophota bacterium]